MGLPQQVFVFKYLVSLPTEKELQMIVEEEKDSFRPNEKFCNYSFQADFDAAESSFRSSKQNPTI